MIERDVEILTRDGSMNSFITYPEEGGPFPVVMFLMDAPGKREELHDMARRLGTSGYYVVLPNLYYRQTAEFVIEAEAAVELSQVTGPTLRPPPASPPPAFLARAPHSSRAPPLD